MLTTNLLNIALNLWFVLGLEWGVLGSARASVLAEWSGALLGLLLAWRTLGRHPGQVDRAALRQWHSWRALLAVNRDILIRTLALHLVFFLITVPMIAPSLAAGAMMSFALSLDDLVLASFVSGPGSTTLPMEIFSAVRLGVKPEINAVASLILLAVSFATFLAWFFAHRAEEKRKKALQQAMDETTSPSWQQVVDSRRSTSSN